MRSATIDDVQLQRDVLDELSDEASVDASQVGVTAKDGVVTLSGFVPSYAEKLSAEEATRCVCRVKAIANDIVVRLGGDEQRTDGDIATAAIDALRWNSMVPDEVISVTVDQGWVTLKATVDCHYQKRAAEESVRHLVGVTGVTNAIAIGPKVKINPGDVKRKIFEIFKRSAQLEARRIGIDVHDGKIILHGNLQSWSEVQAAQRAAWAVPGVINVENRLMILPGGYEA